LSAAEVKGAARGQWHKIFRAQGIPFLTEAVDASPNSVGCARHPGKTDSNFRLFHDSNETGGSVCNTCGVFADGFATLAFALGLDIKREFDRIVEIVAEALGITWTSITGSPSESQSKFPPEKKESLPAGSKTLNVRKSRRLWTFYRDAQPDHPRIIEYFERGRGVPYPRTQVDFVDGDNKESASVFRYHPAFPFKAQGVHPALLAPITKGGKVVGLHAIALDANGPGKANIEEPKRSFKLQFKSQEPSSLAGSGVLLERPGEEECSRKRIHFCEGLETGAAIHAATGETVFCALTASCLRGVDVQKSLGIIAAGVKEFVFWADHDEPNLKRGLTKGVGLQSAEYAARLMVEQGHEVRVLLPEVVNTDWLDEYRIDPPRLRNALANSTPWKPEDGDNRTPIHHEPDAIHKTVEQLEIALSKHPAIFQQNSRLVKLAMREDRSELAALTVDSLAEIVSQVAYIERANNSSDGEGKSAIPKGVLLALRDRGDYPAVRPIGGFSAVPITRPDGTIWQTSGYDARTSRFYSPACEYPKIPDRPTRDDALAAMRIVLDPFAEFPFATAADQAAVPALLITLVCPDLIEGPRPLISVEASDPGSGKGKLLTTCAVIATGQEAGMDPFPTGNHADEVLSKRLDTAAINGTPLVVFDNAAKTIGSPILDAFVTAARWTGRRFGTQQQFNVRNTTCAAVTANNPPYGADTRRRALRIRLEPDEDPARRKFARELPRYAAERRAEIVAAILTVVRAYFVAGQPKHELPAWGSYESWSIVREICVFAGLADPAGTRDLLEDHDTTLDELADVHRALAEGHARYSDGMTMNQLARLASENEDSCPSLFVLADRCPPQQKLSLWLGYLCRKFRGRVLDNQKIECVGKDRTNVQKWGLVVHVRAGDAGDALAPPSHPLHHPLHLNSNNNSTLQHCAGDAGDVSEPLHMRAENQQCVVRDVKCVDVCVGAESGARGIIPCIPCTDAGSSVNRSTLDAGDENGASPAKAPLYQEWGEI